MDDLLSKFSSKWVKTNIIFLTKHGSHAYGTNIETSDIDYKGIIVPPKEYFLGFNKHFEQFESNDPDIVIYDIRKFFKLAADCNPNIIEVLWTDPKHHVVVNEVMTELFENRHLFLSKKCRYTFCGYAVAQLKRIKTHRHWLLNPPKSKPTRSDFGLNDRKMDENQLDAAIDVSCKNVFSFDTNFMEVIEKEKAYKQAVFQWGQYQSWLANRNKKRAELEAKCGFDTKHAIHLVRLLRMAEEILSSGQVIVERPDHAELLKIRNGAWTYDELIKYAEQKENDIGNLYDTSILRNTPDINKLDELCQSITCRMLNI